MHVAWPERTWVQKCSQRPKRLPYHSSIHSFCTETIASRAESNSENITASSVICGCRAMRIHIIARTVDFAASVGLRISNIAMIAACVSTKVCTQTTIARAESTNQTALSAKNFSLAREVLPTKCPVVMPFIGNVLDSWQPTIHVALFAKRRRKRRNV